MARSLAAFQWRVGWLGCSGTDGAPCEAWSRWSTSPQNAATGGGLRPTASHPRRWGRRRGSVYIVVVGVALIVSVLALGAIMVRRIERQTAQTSADMAEARLYAHAAIQQGLLQIKNDPNWRTTYSNGVWAASKPVGSGTYTLEGIDPNDGVLDNSDTDPLVLIGSGVKGQATQKMQVTLVAYGSALTCLEVSMHANSDVSFYGSTVTGDQIISANNNVTASSANVNADVEAVGAITGGTYTKTQTPGITPRTVPDPLTVFDEYKASGTWISISSLSLVSGISTITEEYVGPDDPPGTAAATDPNGVYVIDCQGQMVQIRNSRIVGTLVLLNAGNGTSVYYSVNWEPALSNYPALLVEGPMDLVCTNAPLSEADVGKDLNGDSDTVDTFPSVISGLVYISGDSSTGTGPLPVNYSKEQITVTIDGVFVVGNSYMQSFNGGDMNLTYRSTFLDDPPPGFTGAGAMKISSGSWEQVVD